MKMNLVQIQISVRNKLLNIRSIDYFVNTTKFEEAFNNCSDKDQESIIDAIEEQQPGLLKGIIDRILKEDLIMKPIKDLRNLANKLQINNFSRYNKEQLLIVIKEKLNEEGRS